MTRSARIRIIAGALAILACGAADWVDDPDAPGRAASMKFQAIDVSAPVSVRPLDNSPSNLKVAGRLAQALRERGRRVSDQAALVLELETATESSVTAAPLRPVIEARRVDIGRKRDLGRSDAVDARVDLYSNARNSLLAGIRPPDIDVRYVLRATLTDRSGARLWEGWIEYGAVARDDEQIYLEMAPLLAGMVGEASGERRFRAE